MIYRTQMSSRRMQAGFPLLLLFVFLLLPKTAAAQDSGNGDGHGSPVPEHVRPCLETLPRLFATRGVASITIRNGGNDCSLLISFELQSDLDRFRWGREAAGLSPEFIKYTRPDGTLMKLPLVLRKTAMRPQ